MQKIKRQPITIQNRKAKFDYHILETWTTGLVLKGSEVRSIRLGKCNLIDAYCRCQSGELFIHNLDIPINETAFQHEPKAVRKMLVTKKELKRINNLLEQGITLIPLRIFEVKGIFKCEMALARGKKSFDKRQCIKERETEREIKRNLK